MNNDYKIINNMIDKILDGLEDIAKYYSCSIEEAMQLSIESLKKGGDTNAK